jgi:hypothetical protein
MEPTMLIVRRLITDVRTHFRFRLTEWLLTGEIFAFGLALAGPNPLFAESNNYNFMARFSSEMTWALIFIGVGISRASVLFVNGTFPKFRRWSPSFRSALAMTCAVLWVFYCIGAFTAPSPSAGSLTYALLLICEIIISVWTAREAGEAERQHREARG